MATEEREKKRRITDPVLVDLCDIFEDGTAQDAIAVLTFMKLKTVEDIYITYPGLLAIVTANEALFKKLGQDMKAAGLLMTPQVVWNSVDDDAAVAATHKGQLLRVCRRAFQATKASETYDYATALAKEDKRQRRELSLNQTKASEKEAQLACRLYGNMIEMVYITIPQADQAPSTLVYRLYTGMRNGTLTPRDLDVTKFVARSSLSSVKDMETRLGDSGDLRLVSKEEATIDSSSVASVLLAMINRGNCLLAVGFHQVEDVKGVEHMYTQGDYGYHPHPLVADPNHPGKQMRPDPPGYWYYICPHAVYVYFSTILNALKAHTIKQVLQGDNLMWGKILDHLNTGLNISSAIVTVCEATSISQLLSSAGLMSTHDAGRNKRGTPEKPTKRAFDAGKGSPKGVTIKTGGKPSAKADTDKQYDGLCNLFNGTGPPCNNSDCRYTHQCRTCGDTSHGAAKCNRRNGRRN